MRVIELSNHPGGRAGDSDTEAAGYVLSLVHDSGTKLDQRQRAEVQRLIRRDHDLYQRRRR
jgi:hypothetical protein